MKNLTYFLLSICFMNGLYAQQKNDKPLQLSAGAQYVHEEFKFSEKGLSDKEKESLSYVPQTDGKPIVAFYLAAARPLDKKTKVLAKITVGCGENESTQGHSNFWTNPNNKTDYYVIPNPGMGIEGVFDYTSYSGPLNASTKFSFQELSVGIARNFGERLQLEASCGLDHRRQKTTISQEDRKYVVNYTTDTELVDNTYYIENIVLGIQHEKIGESEEIITQDYFNGSLRANAIFDVLRSHNKKFILAVEGGGKLLLGGNGSQLNSNVGLKITKKL